MNLAVETRSLAKAFGPVRAVDGCSLEVPAGTIFALLGPNGAGKSTLLKLLIGLQRPTGGEGSCLGLDIRTRAVAIREQVGYMGEEPRLYGYMTPVQLAGFCRGFYRAWDAALVERCLDTFRLPRNRKIHGFSQGMKNQLALTMALAPRPPLLILDEPTTSFDPVMRRLFFSLLLEEVAARGGTILMASHQLDEVERVADRVALMRKGRILRSASLDDLKSGEKELRVVFQKEPPPELLARPGITAVAREGKAYRLQVAENLEEIWQACAELPHYALEVIDRDLEEIFLRCLAEGAEGDD